MFCNKCGSALSPRAMVCSKCGTLISKEQSEMFKEMNKEAEKKGQIEYNSAKFGVNRDVDYRSSDKGKYIKLYLIIGIIFIALLVILLVG